MCDCGSKGYTNAALRGFGESYTDAALRGYGESYTDAALRGYGRGQGYTAAALKGCGRLRKGSKEAKAYMAKLRAMRTKGGKRVNDYPNLLKLRREILARKAAAEKVKGGCGACIRHAKWVAAQKAAEKANGGSLFGALTMIPSVVKGAKFLYNGIKKLVDKRKAKTANANAGNAKGSGYGGRHYTQIPFFAPYTL